MLIGGRAGTRHRQLVSVAGHDGDDTFARLILQHLPRMRAVAIAVLGPGDDAEDAVQDAVLVALHRIGDLRDPAAAGSWLRTIVRNNCRMLLRSRRAVPIADPEQLLPADPAPGPEEILDRAGTRDWVRHAIGTLPEPVREVTVLRYFTGHSSYAQIAELCAVSADTVRSRLRDGRRVLQRALRESAPAAYADSDARVTAARDETEDLIGASRGDGFAGMIRDRCHPDMSLILAGSLTGDSGSLRMLVDHTYSAGVALRLREVTVSQDLMVWETDFVNPPDAPEHCPPGLIWLHSLREGRTQRLRLAYRLDGSPRDPEPAQ